MRPRIHRWTVALVLLAFAPLAFAQGVAEPASIDIAALVKTIQSGAQAGNWGPVAVALLMLSVVAVRWFASKFPDLKAFAWVNTTAGGWSLNLGGSALAALLALFGSGGPITVVTVLGAIVSAVITGFAAAGALEAKKDLLGGAKVAGDAAAADVVGKAGSVELFRKGPLP